MVLILLHISGKSLYLMTFCLFIKGLNQKELSMIFSGWQKVDPSSIGRVVSKTCFQNVFFKFFEISFNFEAPSCNSSQGLIVLLRILATSWRRSMGQNASVRACPICSAEQVLAKCWLILHPRGLCLVYKASYILGLGPP